MIDLRSVTIREVSRLSQLRKLSADELIQATLRRSFDETTILRIGHTYEQATPWRRQRPPMN